MDAVAKSKSSATEKKAKLPDKIGRVGIIGSGQMGSGIAHVVALAGHDVVLNDLKKEAADKAIANIEKNMGRQVARGIIKDAEMQTALRRIS